MKEKIDKFVMMRKKKREKNEIDNNINRDATQIINKYRMIDIDESQYNKNIINKITALCLLLYCLRKQNELTIIDRASRD